MFGEVACLFASEQLDLHTPHYGSFMSIESLGQLGQLRHPKLLQVVNSELPEIQLQGGIQVWYHESVITIKTT